MKYILGISAFYHDSAATLLLDGKILCAFQEERFSRIKQDKSFPVNAIKECLKWANITLIDIDQISYYENPQLKFQRICKTYISNFPRGIFSFLLNFPKYFKYKNISKILRLELHKHFKCNHNIKLFFSEHHLSHAASAFYPAPFQKAAILCIDGVGEWATVTAWRGEEKNLSLLWQINFPHSLGLLYSAFTYFCGFKVDSGEYKLMGLAPYGKPRYADLILEHLIHIDNEGNFTLNRRYFNYEVGNKMISTEFCQLFGGAPRKSEAEITEREMDLAASIQVITEQVIIQLAKRLKKETKLDNLCLAGGVALNCVANGKLLKSGLFKEIYIQPAAGDAGTSLGAAFVAHYAKDSANRFVAKYDDPMQGAYLGNEYTNSQIKNELERFAAVYVELNETDLLTKVSQNLKDEKVIGWFQGRMEFGPRALGARSILGNPMGLNMQSVINQKIKKRESFRPFAPAVLSNYVQDWFECTSNSPYMLIVADVHKSKRITSENPFTSEDSFKNLSIQRSVIPAVTHVDFSARIQTIDGKYNPLFYGLLENFYQLTGCPILINTSFNIRGEPIVESPLDAYRCFMQTDMDYLLIGYYYLSKNEQPPLKETINWMQNYELD
jgi:carbamoyltransferase